MRLRGATSRDYSRIDELLKDSGLTLDFPNLQQVAVVVDDTDEVIAVGSLALVLEAAFLVDKHESRKVRVAALQMLLDQSNLETKALGHKRFYSFVHGGNIIKLLKRKFNFLYAGGINMVRWV